MKNPFFRHFITLTVALCLFFAAMAQPGSGFPEKENKPYRILTYGKKITIKSTQDIQSIMVWTASGHRIMEQKEINSSSISFTVPANEKICFVMMEIKGEKRFTEKIGVQ
jgi:hypothetical protein